MERFCLGEKILKLLRHKAKLAAVRPPNDSIKFMEIVAKNKAAYLRFVGSPQTDYHPKFSD